MKLLDFKLGRHKSGTESAGKTTSGVKGMPLASFWLVAFAGAALVLVVGVGVLAMLQLEAARTGDQQRMRLIASSLAQRLSAVQGLRYHLLQEMGGAPDVVEAFARGDEQALRRKERALTEILPDILGVRLLPPGYDRVDSEGKPPVGYGSLALMRIAEKAGQPPPLEVHMTRDGRPQVAGAAAVVDEDGRPLGLVFVAFDATKLQGIPAKAGPLPGYLDLQQKVDGNQVTLFSARRQPPGMGPPDATLPVAGTQLRLAYWYRPDSLPGGGMLVWAAGIVLVGLLAVGGLMALQQRRLRKALDADQAVLIHLVEDVLAGRAPRRLQLKVRDFSYTLELLAQRLKTVRSKAAAGGHVPGPPQPAPGGAVETAGPPDVPDTVMPEMLEEAAPDIAFAAGHVELPEVVFRAYDIRGVADSTVTPDVVREIGRAIGSQAYDRGQQSVIVGRDARASGEALAGALIEGLTATGRDVIDLGIVPVPVLYFATHFLGSNAGVMVTGSHNPPEYNGLKVVMGGETLSGGAIHALRERVESGDLLEGAGSVSAQDLVPDYIERIADDVRIARTLKVVVDCGGDCAGLVAPALYRALGCEVVELFCDVNGGEAGHHPDPSRPENLRSLQQAVMAQGADIGLAYDGDGDSLGVVDSRGRIIWPDRLLMLLAADVLSRHPGGDVVFDVKCSRVLGSQILQSGGRPVMWKAGHSPMKAKLNETGALLAGGWSGHIVFKERWFGFDDALYAGARLLEILAEDPRSSAEVFDEYPESASTPELLLPLREGEQSAVMERVIENAGLLTGAKITTIDGLRAEFEEGWGLVRASNTVPALSFRFEADDEGALESVQARYRALMQQAAPELKLPF